MVSATAMVSTVCGGIATLAGLYYSKGIDAHIRLMKAKKDSNLDALERAKADIGEIKGRLDVAERHNDECVERHQECEKRCSLMEGKLSILERRIDGIN